MDNYGKMKLRRPFQEIKVNILFTNTTFPIYPKRDGLGLPQNQMKGKGPVKCTYLTGYDKRRRAMETRTFFTNPVENGSTT